MSSEHRDDTSDDESLAESIIVNETDSFIYISDPQTYDVLYVNAFGKRQLNLDEVKGHKCYRLFQGKEKPCEFCTNHLLNSEKFYTWEHLNECTGRNYLIKDKLIEWQGRRARLEIAVDITEKENTSRAVRDKLEMQHTLVECLRIFYTATSFDEAIDAILRKIGQQHHADRAYIFEYSTDKLGRVVVNNTHEWCAAGIEPQMDILRDLPGDVLVSWNKLFGTEHSIVIRDLENIRESHPQPYGFLKPQLITSLMASLFIVDGTATGFIGVDNPRHMGEDLSLLWSLAYFMAVEQKKRRMEDDILYLSHHDSLTGLCNRHSYMLLLDELKSVPLVETGVAFVDLNGLKSLNDREGHTAGDIFLKTMGEVFTRHFRKDEVFRIGGDEFVIVCRGIPFPLFRKKLHAMRTEAEALYPKALALGSVWKKSGGNPVEMARLADERMYADKRRHYCDRNQNDHPARACRSASSDTMQKAL
ncbi:diguanylate cyclase (GGDEF) domain-containing protein [Desulfovibrio sp. 3_1_syn3]|uniref:GGDEF domain-containing protein n=1 Tax=Desulfovibrio sp. 3_1_syn3 TaxID=457398 RepID=UPI0001E12B11|nr:sensor domain-containing diguanylate cyclase [Desulfovibrio sp. 3_1_syn3]EFL84858.1 diguanylate cyclase (GGDEF) domain-containing protein [Desulfovibrio sp. 3_1_syn3]